MRISTSPYGAGFGVIGSSLSIRRRGISPAATATETGATTRDLAGSTQFATALDEVFGKDYANSALGAVGVVRGELLAAVHKGFDRADSTSKLRGLGLEFDFADGADKVLTINGSALRRAIDDRPTELFELLEGRKDRRQDGTLGFLRTAIERSAERLRGVAGAGVFVDSLARGRRQRLAYFGLLWPTAAKSRADVATAERSLPVAPGRLHGSARRRVRR